MRLGFIGTGEITASIVTGLSSIGAAGHTIWLSPRNTRIAGELAGRFPGVHVASNNQEVLERCDTIVIAVRPTAVREVLEQLQFRPDHRVISVVSALALHDLTELVAPAAQIARAVPLPSSAKRMSPTAIYPNDGAAAELFGAVGTVFPVEREAEFEAICATTATIASYFAWNETIASWLERQGIPASQANDYVAKLYLGVASGAADAPTRGFQSLADTHATTGGINEQFRKYMLEHGVFTRAAEGLDAVLRRISARGEPRNDLSRPDKIR